MGKYIVAAPSNVIKPAVVDKPNPYKVLNPLKNIIELYNYYKELKTGFEKLNRYRRGLETCPEAKTSESGHAIISSFFPTRPSPKYTGHFVPFSLVSVNV